MITYKVKLANGNIEAIVSIDGNQAVLTDGYSYLISTLIPTGEKATYFELFEKYKNACKQFTKGTNTVPNLNQIHELLTKLSKIKHGGQPYKITKGYPDGTVDITSENNTTIYKYKL